MSEDIQVGNVNKPAVRRPLPKKTEKPAAETVTAETTETNSDDIAALNAKMEEVLKFLQAIDWKMWIYLKSNNYIE